MTDSELSKLIKLEQVKADHQGEIETFKGIFQFGGAALKSSILINGGGVIVLFAFIGKIWNPDHEATVALVSNLTCPLTVFTFGVLSAAVAAGTSYLSQYYDSQTNHPQDKIETICRGITIGLIILSYILYTVGAIFTSQALSH